MDDDENAARDNDLRVANNVLKFWFACPIRRCRRARSCVGDWRDVTRSSAGGVGGGQGVVAHVARLASHRTATQAGRAAGQAMAEAQARRADAKAAAEMIGPRALLHRTNATFTRCNRVWTGGLASAGPGQSKQNGDLNDGEKPFCCSFARGIGHGRGRNRRQGSGAVQACRGALLRPGRWLGEHEQYSALWCDACGDQPSRRRALPRAAAALRSALTGCTAGYVKKAPALCRGFFVWPAWQPGVPGPRAHAKLSCSGDPNGCRRRSAARSG